MKKIFLYALALLFYCGGCTKSASVASDPAKAVIEAYLSPNRPLQMTITKELAFSDTTTVKLPIDNLSVQLQFNGQTRLLKSQGSGKYASDFPLDSNKTYAIQFNYNGNSVYASTFVPTHTANFKSNVTKLVIQQFDLSSGSPPSFPDPVKLSWTSADSAYYLVVVENTESSPTLINSGFGSSSDRPKLSFKESPAQTNTSEIRSMQFQYYGAHRLILYRLNSEYASLYNDNGSSSLNLTAPYTNVVNGLGIFTGVASDTLPLTVAKK